MKNLKYKRDKKSGGYICFYEDKSVIGQGLTKKARMQYPGFFACLCAFLCAYGSLCCQKFVFKLRNAFFQ